MKASLLITHSVKIWKQFNIKLGLTCQKRDQEDEGGADAASHDEDDAFLGVRELRTVQLKQ